ncbi:hypothetical protein B0H63DRAFT_484283 [Podospora didyma]|uniref:Uncharacterized protein n=1 Tax=Podospora didyma TaxID=330526 RepID=A0AAE0N672_9PEZI|nr:hypothetical protein B0H63DRAFT_484283 [Podospora didyma]
MILPPVSSALAVAAAATPFTSSPTTPAFDHANTLLDTNTVLAIISIVISILAVGLTYVLSRLQLRAAYLQLQQARVDNGELRHLVEASYIY